MVPISFSDHQDFDSLNCFAFSFDFVCFINTIKMFGGEIEKKCKSHLNKMPQTKIAKHKLNVKMLPNGLSMFLS